MKRLLAGALLTAGLIGGAAAPASAAPPQRSVYPEQCYVYEDGSRECFGGTSTFKINEKSGDTYMGMYRDSYTLSYYDADGVLQYRSESKGQGKFKVREGQETMYSSRFSGTDVFDGQACTYTSTFRIIKGVVKVDRFSSSCSFA